jgi:DnaJ-class molecular chaperone
MIQSKVSHGVDFHGLRLGREMKSENLHRRIYRACLARPQVMKRKRLYIVTCSYCDGTGVKHKPSGGTLILVQCDQCNGTGMTQAARDFLKRYKQKAKS